jgi:cell division protein FtsI (penicillin-binding protein 3)
MGSTRFSPIRQSRSSKSSGNLEKFHFNLVGVFISLLGLGVLASAFRWQILDSEKFTSLAQAQYIDSQRQATSRGVIYASDGTILAVDQPVWGIYATLSKDESERELFFEHKDKFIATVAGILGLDKAEIEEKITDDFVYFKIKTGVSSEKKKALQDADIFGSGTEGFGLYFEKEEKRVYPDGDLASHILGFIGKDENGEDVGQYGIEGFYFGDITGQAGYTYEEKDSSGNVILTSEYEPILAREGKSFELTILPGIQKKVQQELKEGVEHHQAKSGSAIIMDPNTGAILAMANYPDYNPNEYWRVSDPWIFRNKAIADVYEYGSIQKPITVAIGLESGKVDGDYICKDRTGSLKLFDKTIYTWNKQPSGDITLGGILEKSNNPCASKVALEAGHQYYYPKLKEFGIGSFIGIGLQDEATGYLTPFEFWTKLDLAVTAFGQSVSATPLQILSALSTISNEGNRMRPYIISKIEESDETIKYSPQVIAEPISEKTADMVAEMMHGVVENGEARGWFSRELPNYDIAGKTGTAQIPRKDRAGYYDDRTNATFVGFSPVEDAKMIMLVRLEEPKLNTFAASTAVPLWVNIFKAVADDLEIPKSN